MTLTFITNLVHHHQLPVADEFYKLLGDDYHYIATEPLPEWLVRGGYDPTLDRPYIVRSYRSCEEMELAKMLVDESDVVIHGAANEAWSLDRKEADKVTFHYSERWLKKISIHSLSPRFLLGKYKYYFRFRNKRTYMLCASAFTAQDVHRYGCFPNRCFKWGYFTKVDDSFEIKSLNLCASTSKITPIMWCARFLRWKHPELPVKLAARLKAKGYHFTLDMFGSGEEMENTKALIAEMGVEDCIRLCGNRPNDNILLEMRRHKIFLFTSDRNEGWGAVLNEAMANGCVPVASDAIGSVPYLVKNGVNGMTFHSCDIDSLFGAVCALLDNKIKMNTMAVAALRTMQYNWSPRMAAENFIDLAQHILHGILDQYSREDGPASWDRR
jgi:glycosyltransferase involved in cell wall biosynthesis